MFLRLYVKYSRMFIVYQYNISHIKSQFSILQIYTVLYYVLYYIQIYIKRFYTNL